jgi:DeoR/GlpR family transcriptional regulator of sugar metabolism
MIFFYTFATSFKLKLCRKDNKKVNAKMKRIIVDYGTVTELCRTFGVSMVTVRRALRYETSTELAGKIRAVAMKKGGVELDEQPKNQKI